MNARSLVCHGLLGLVALAPLPFGANRPWAWSLLSFIIGVLLLAWLFNSMWARLQTPVSIARIRFPALLFMFGCVLAALQAVPGIPDSIANSYWDIAISDDLGPSLSISVSRYDTLTSLMRLLAYGAVFWLALQCFRERDSAKRAVLGMSLVTASFSSYGLVLQFLGAQNILWFEKWAYLDSLTSTFVNRNSFATFSGLGLLCSVAYAVQLLSSGKKTKYGDTLSLHRAVSAVSKFELPFFLSLAAAVLNSSALILTGSRGGVTSAVVAIFVFILGVALRAKRAGRASVLMLTLLFSTGGLIFSLSGQHVEQRLDRLVAQGGFSATERAQVYERTVVAIGDYPILGTGYGTYADFFQSYRIPGVRGFFDLAHNTYLELALELGLPASCCLILAVSLLSLRCFGGLERQSSAYVWAWLGFCVSVQVGTHALVDFSLQMPAVACLYACVLGLGVAQSWSASVNTSIAHTAPS